jgi:hypothetical protein
MYHYILGIIFLIPLYYYRTNVIYYFILFYDKLLTYKQKKMTCTGINNKVMVEFNYSLDNEYLKYDIILVNFNINNKTKRLIYNSSVDFSLLNSLPDYNSSIILATIDLYDNDNNCIRKEIDITEELNEFILYNCSINLNNKNLSKLMWISIINAKFYTYYPTDLTIVYSLMKDDISTLRANEINIVVKDGELSFC